MSDLKNYDPNIRMAVHKVELTFMQWDYTATLIGEVRGNCRGLDILRYALSDAADKLVEQTGERVTLVLSRPAEDGKGIDTLECEDDDYDRRPDAERFLEAMCVGARIISHEQDPKYATGSQS